MLVTRSATKRGGRYTRVQFVIVFLHSSQLLLFECNYPKGIVALLGVNALYFLYLFGTFYRRTYFQRSCKKDD
uniref:Very-long-chain 3-oxoacyl-CoA synthase n=1 Tax=Timema douglasi TaxID=61478 RepID=A0A7R8ZH55_TIMDO|nr:unnamed protein product [Timema douglasi]